MFVYYHGQNLGLFLLSISYFLCTTSIWFFWIEKITCNFEIGLLAGALLAGALLAGALLAGVLLAWALWAAHSKLNMEKDHIILTMIINKHDVINEHTGKKVSKINEHTGK